jgi:hypothetical protein
MEQYLWAFRNWEQDNWVELLPLAEFTYIQVVHTSTILTPSWGNYHYHPVIPCQAPKQPSSLNSEIQAHTVPAGLEETQHTLRKKLMEAQASHMKYAYDKEVVFEIGDLFWQIAWHLQTTRRSKKFKYKQI